MRTDQIRQFVSNTLLEISRGVKDAVDCEDDSISNAKICPADDPKGNRLMQQIDYEIFIDDENNDRQTTPPSVIRFSVPVQLPNPAGARNR